jgi:hypothetical protein
MVFEITKLKAKIEAIALNRTVSNRPLQPASFVRVLLIDLKCGGRALSFELT